MTDSNKLVNKIGDRLVIFILNNKALFLLVLLGIFSQAITNGKFLLPGNLVSVSRQIAVSTLISVGFTIILASGGIDLSVGAMLSLVGICYGYFSLYMPIGISIILALLLGAFCGLFNGAIIKIFKLPGFVLTLAMAQVYKGAAYLLCGGKSVSGFSSSLKYLGQGIVFRVIPVPAIIMIFMVVVVAVLIAKTKYGRQLIATGGNAEAASVSGINITFIRISAYMITGFCVALGAVVMTGRVATALPNAGDGTEMDAIAAVVIGGTPLHGGRAKVVGTLFGVMLIGVIGNTLNLVNVSPFWQWVSKGLIIVVAIVLDSLTESFFNKRRGLV